MLLTAPYHRGDCVLGRHPNPAADFGSVSSKLLLADCLCLEIWFLTSGLERNRLALSCLARTLRCRSGGPKHLSSIICAYCITSKISDVLYSVIGTRRSRGMSSCLAVVRETLMVLRFCGRYPPITAQGNARGGESEYLYVRKKRSNPRKRIDTLSGNKNVVLLSCLGRELFGDGKPAKSEQT